MTELGFIHRFLPGAGANSPVLLMLHGTGGDENDLIPLAAELLPGAAVMSPRGKVLENGMPRFFRRLAEGIFDLEDLKRRTVELAQFIEAARREYGLAESKVFAVGYSNGANIAASLILQEPGHLSGAVLFRAMVPFTPDTLPNLGGLPIFMSSGREDPIIPAANSSRLAEIFESGGARVSMHWHDGGHELGRDDISAAKLWISRNVVTTDQPVRR